MVPEAFHDFFVASTGTGQPFAAAFPAFHENEVTRLLAGLSLQGLQLSVPFLLCRIDIDVMMHHLPPLPLLCEESGSGYPLSSS